MAHTPIAGSTTLDVTADSLLQKMIQANASDLHLIAGSSPSFRIDGRITKLHEVDPLSHERLRALADELMNPEQRQIFEADGDLDFAYAIEGVGRFRINVLRHRSAVGMVVRAIPSSVPTGDQLGLPIACRDLALRNRGMVLVTGPTGSGKSTTLAALIDYINTFQERHILTLEDPVEFVHRAKQGIITQREIGSDCASFAQALRRAMRQDPDIIAIGELRDLDSISMALEAAETGHLVFSTLHTTGASATIDRMIDVFPPDAQEQVRTQIAATLQGIISQTLVPRADGGRVAAYEILIVTDAVRSMIRDGKTAQLHNVLQTGKSHGMLTLEESLIRLVQSGVITPECAIDAANRKDEVAAHAAPPAPSEEDEPAEVG